MNRTLHVHFLPDLTSIEHLRGATVVVIDVLRASTTIIEALAADAAQVLPYLSVEESLERAATFPRGEVVLGGERGGRKIDLFDLGNSPAEYTEESVGGKSVIFTTTNGTRALNSCREAHRVLIGSPVNLSAVSAAVADTLNVHLLCAGTNGAITREDILGAGAIVYKLAKDDSAPVELDDAAHIARAAWRTVVAGAFGHGQPLSQWLAHEMRATRGGRNLLALGYESDLVVAADIDRHDVVPELDLKNWRIYRPQAAIDLP